jgi:tyrosine-protein kinase Etk/Wzc
MSRQLDHYIHLLQRKWWFVLPVTAAVIIIYALAVNKLGISRPKLDATAILQFDDPDELSSVQERVVLESDAKAVLVRSRSFLEGIVRKLSLQLEVSRYSRSEIFDSVWVGIDAPIGDYEFRPKGDSYSLLFTDRMSAKTRIASGEISTLKETSLPGLTLLWSQDFLSGPRRIKFRVLRTRDAIDRIVDNLTVKTSGKDFTIMSVSLSGRDYEMITSTVNAIAQDFVEENSNTKRSRKGEVMELLEKQLETARREMVAAEANLRKFREANPTVGLPDAFSPPVTILDLKETEAELKSALLQARGLQDRYRITIDTMRIPVLNEMISFLNRYQTGTAEALGSELQGLIEESRRLRDQYSPLHPIVTQHREDVRNFGTKVTSALYDLMNQLSRRISENNTRIDKINSEIAKLPSKELHLSNLQRKYEVNSEIYANVLTRYNEAKIARAMEVGDVYVVDLAVVPEGSSDPKALFVLVGMGLFLGLLAGVGPVLVVDFFDQTARTEKDLRRMTDLLILEAVPIKGCWGKGKGTIEEKCVDSKLVAADYSQNYVDETYRSLRTKILLSLHEEKRKRIIITSLNMGEGKSFTAANLAITMAQQRIPTLLLDGDLRRGIQHLHFGLEKQPGLSNILSDSSPLSASYLQPSIQSTHINYLSIIGSGSTVPNSAELINSLRFRELLDILSDNFEIIIMDTPPVAVTTDAVGVQDIIHKYMFVVRAGHTNIAELNRKIKEFPGLHKKVLGLIFNGAPYRRTEYYQYASYKY